MAPTVPHLIDLDEDSDDSVFNEEFVDENRIGHGVEGLSITPSRGRSEHENGGHRNRPEDYQACLTDMLDVFPDISHEYVQEIYNKHMDSRGPYQPESPSQALIEKVLDSGHYPKEKDRRKRKFSERDSDEEEAAKWKYKDLRDDPTQYQTVAKIALQEAFELVPAKFIDAMYKEHHHYYGAFFAILEAERGLSSARPPPFAPLKSRRVSTKSSAAIMAQLEQDGFDFENLKKEIDSAFQRRKKDESNRKAARDAKQAEDAEDQRLRAMGEVMECQCCYDDCIPPKMTHCDGEGCHFFCLDCAKTNANTVIGNSRYILQCMDGSGCKATFSRYERSRFLDDKTIEKLERLQQQDEIRMAEIQNLSTCPFCDFAAICVPVEEDREFRCHNPECEEVSCRLCKAKTHIPMSCEEFKKETGVSERRVIEEARTEALIRTCGKCQVRILKEEGCNKVICTSCSAVLCDYCGKDISKVMYNHFDGQGRAPPGVTTNGPGAKCPLYDESNKRKDRQVEEAEKQAMAKVRAEHPDLSEDDLKIKFAESVESTNRPHQHWRMHHHPDFDEVVIPPFEVMANERIRHPGRHERHRVDPQPRPQAPFQHLGRPEYVPLNPPQEGQQQPPARQQGNALDPEHAYRQLQQQRHLMQMHAARTMQQQEDAVRLNLQQQQRARQQQQEEQIRHRRHVQQERMNEVLGHHREHIQIANEVLGNAHRREPRGQDRGVRLADIEPPRANALNLRRGIDHLRENDPAAANSGIGNRAFEANGHGLWGGPPPAIDWNADALAQNPIVQPAFRQSLSARREQHRQQRLGLEPTPAALFHHQHHQRGPHTLPNADPWTIGPVPDEAPRDNQGNYWFG
ncbi:hypothetical protein JMJ35_005502 [Cladonia borealis]|uniref:RING-type domain-containing protein n=1 Tax=Cladonia borealis TaxID=184061 RepID=A0AA39R2E7_9LECA|nr:hypothetical protein JMJ35_005502 [Cladonia borealis]